MRELLKYNSTDSTELEIVTAEGLPPRHKDHKGSPSVFKGLSVYLVPWCLGGAPPTSFLPFRKMLKYILPVFFGVITVSCEKDFAEINRNPFNPTQTEMGPLFNTVVSSLQLGWDEQFYLHNETLYGVTQQAALTAETFQNISIGTEDVWTNYYRALAHIREIEARLDAMDIEPEAQNNVRGMLKTVLAYKTFRLTDLFGDIPFFEAGKGFESLDYVRPPFDAQEEIYKHLLTELEWVADHVNTFPNPETANGTSYLNFDGFDHLFNGNMLLVVKMANALRLRHAMRMVEKEPAFAEPIIKDILENDLPVLEDGENIGMSPDVQDWRNLSVNWSFREHKKLRMGTTIWRLMSEHDSLDGSGIFDPRAYFFFEPNNAGEWAPFPQVPDEDTPPSGGIPYQQHRDNNYALKGQSNIYSPFNYYLIRDEKDVPEIIITAAEVHFLKAEAYLRGLGVAQNESEADAEYTLGVAASIQAWQDIVVNSDIWTNAPPALTQGEIFGVINHPRISIFEAPDKLERIYAQRWLDAFRQPWEAYALARRTEMTPREGPPIDHFRFPYPPSEAENNPDNWANQVSKMGEDSPRVKVWWDE